MISTILTSLTRRGSLVLPLFVFGLLFGCGTESKSSLQRETPAFEELHSAVEPGDIIVKCGYGPVSRMIVKFLDEDIPMSHAAIVVSKTDEDAQLVHSISGEISEEDGVQSIELKKFLKDVRKNSFRVLRHKADLAKRTEAAEFAQSLLPLHIPFDQDFDHRDNSALYCSEMVYHVEHEVYGNQCFDVDSIGDIEVMLFNSILVRPEYEVIYSW